MRAISQGRRNSYAAHPFRVCLIVRDVFGFDDPHALAALLHDTIEDTTTDFDDLEERYGREVATWVAHLTQDKACPTTNANRRTSTGSCKPHGKCRYGKLADMFDNLLDSGHVPKEKRVQRSNVQNALQGAQPTNGAEAQSQSRRCERLIDEFAAPV